MNNLKSYTEYAVSTPTTDFVIGFDFNYGTDAVNVTVDGVPASVAGYSVIYLNSTTMRLSPAVPSGVVRLQRETDIDVPDNQFTAGAKFIASNMDENFTQIRHAQQEVRDGFGKLSEDTYEIIDTLQVVGQAAQDAADAAEQAAQTANDAAAQVNDKVSYQDLDTAIAATPHNNMFGRDVAEAHPASAILDASGVNQQEINDKQEDRNTDQINARDWGILPTNSPEVNSANWFALNNAFPEREALDIFVPVGTYNFSEGFYITRPHHIHGIGVGELSQTIFNFAGATPVGTVHYKSSIFIAHIGTVEDTSGNGVTPPVGQVVFSGTGATIDFIKVMNSSEHGIIKNAPSYLNGVAAMNNAKHGILTVANTGTGWARIAGIANQGANTECAALFNGWTGIVEIGDDANVIKNDNCLSAYNNHFGFYDASLLGGVCINNQAHVNVLGDYVQQGSPHDNSGLPSTPSRVVYVGNYAEEQRPSAYSTNVRSIILSATGAQPESHNTNALLSSIVGLLTQNRFSVTQDVQAVYDRQGKDFVSVGLNEILFGSAAAPNSNLAIKDVGNKRFAVQVADSKNAIVFFLEDFSTTLRAERPWFLNGFTMGSTHYQNAGTAAPTTGIWDRGNIVWNESPTAGGKIGWVCVVAGSPGVWKAFGAIDA